MSAGGALFSGVFHGTRVLITGHTGFKGSWLALWLTELGAEVTGFALEPPTDPSLFAEAGIDARIRSVIGDVRDFEALRTVFSETRPEVVLHLAAQPLVRMSYAEPVATYATNVMGTANVLEAVRSTPGVRAVVCVTSDKCYDNREWEYAYRENDAMGGYDPYSSSKGCAEIVTSAYRRSFFSGEGAPGVASARAGNVIGGGDWAADRIVPDCVRALTAGSAVAVRNPEAVRPWQHVLEPLSGYLALASRLMTEAPEFAEAWNFGPRPDAGLTVREVVERVIAAWGSGSWSRPDAGEQPHEAKLLRLDSTKAETRLGWAPVWGIDETVERTTAWYAAWHEDPFSALEATIADLNAYVGAARLAGAGWTTENGA